MIAHIIAVGSELLTPFRQDTNSIELTKRLMDMGIKVGSRTVVPDNDEEIARAIKSLMGRGQLIIITGGLGPTADDRTREGISKALKKNLIFDEEIHQWIKERFKQITKRQPPDNLARMAFVPEGAEVLYNTVGAAPGFWIEVPEKDLRLLVLPGPPAEWKPMFEAVRERLEALGKKNLERRVLRIAGLREAEVEDRISPFITGVKNPSVTILASPEDVQLHIVATSKDPQEANRLVEEMVGKFKEVLGDNIYSFEDEPLEKVVGELLRQKGKTLAVAESCTGGLLSHRITNIPGSSDYFLLGAVTYSNQAKIKVLGVSEENIREFGAVSEPVAKEMAIGVRKLAGADFGIGITGIAGPGGGTPEKPVGLVYIGLSWEGGVEVQRKRFSGTRLQIKTYSTSHALDMLRRRLI